MLPTQRRQAILAQVRRQSAVSADDLAREFGVSVETIRRDLRRLGEKGLLDRVYGGATRPAGRSSEGSFAARSMRRMTAKRAIAQRAASLIEPGETVVIDVGTTALEVARALPASFEGRVLTNSVPVAMELSARREIELLLCGGQVRHGARWPAWPPSGACSARRSCPRWTCQRGGSPPRTPGRAGPSRRACAGRGGWSRPTRRTRGPGHRRRRRSPGGPAPRSPGAAESAASAVLAPFSCPLLPDLVAVMTGLSRVLRGRLPRVSGAVSPVRPAEPLMSQ